MAKADTIEVENIVSPGSRRRVDAGKYVAMRAAILAVLPKAGDGLTVADLRAAVLTKLPDTLFPDGAKAGWWLKCVHLDLEAKGIVKRSPKPPVWLTLS